MISTYRNPRHSQHVKDFMNGADLWLIAHAIEHASTIATFERSSGGSTPQRPKIPDVCNHFNVPCERPFDVWEKLGLKLG